jgi:hypothetical protein
MGCHTWFYKPVTQMELDVFKSHAIEEAFDLYGDTEINKKNNLVRLDIYEKIKESVIKDTTYWWNNEYGCFGTCGESVMIHDGKLYLELIDGFGYDLLFTDLKRFHDVFRVKNYPKKVIHSRKELRRWMRKRYFELEDWQLKEISEFFRMYPGGFITFG